MNRREEVRQVFMAAKEKGLPLLACFIKADDSNRHMLCSHRGGRTRRPWLLAVWDIADNGRKTVNLDTTYRIVNPVTGEILFDKPLEP